HVRLFCSFLFCSRAPCALPSFPTRRSSDLATASRWGEWRGGAEPEIIDCGAPSLLAGKLSKAAELGAELAVIDTPPHADAMARQDRKSTRLNSSHQINSYAGCCLTKKKH